MFTNNRQDMLRIATGLLLSFVVGYSSSALDGQEANSPWQVLKEDTAWIILGYIEGGSGNWVTLPAYDIVRRRVPGDPRTPAIGEVLSVKDQIWLYILDFKNSGEERRLEWPGGRPLEDADLTGGVLKPGTRVVVKEVRRDTGSRCNTACAVWARVSPEQPR